MNYKTTIDILSRGWFVRIFILLLWLIAVVMAFYLSEDKLFFIITIITSSNMLLYAAVSNRVFILANKDISLLLPNYFKNIKKSLLIILLSSLLPSLVLLNHPKLFFDQLSILLIFAILFMIIVYIPKISFIFVFFALIPYSIDKFSTFFTAVNFSLILAYIFPCLAVLTYYLLNRLETFKGDKKQVARIIALTSLNIKKIVVSQDSVPLNSRNRFTKWLINSNFSYYLKLISQEKKLSKSQIIAITCQSIATIGSYTYLFWTIAVVAFSIIATQLFPTSQHFFIPMMIVFPSMMFATGTITVFQLINNKKSLLQRLAIMPIFHKKYSFARAFLTYVIASQLKLYVFTAFVVALLAYRFNFISLSMYFNVLLSVLSLVLLNLMLMFSSWGNKHAYGNIAIWLMVLVFFIFIVFLVIIHADKMLLLWKSTVFLTYFIVCVGLFGGSLYRVFKRVPLSLI